MQVFRDPLGAEDAPAVAAFYVGHNDAFYIRKGHDVGQLLADAEKLLDGTVLKPRRVFEAPDGDRIMMFTTPAQRVGVGAGRRPVAQVVSLLQPAPVIGSLAGER